MSPTIASNYSGGIRRASLENGQFPSHNTSSLELVHPSKNQVSISLEHIRRCQDRKKDKSDLLPCWR